MAKHEFSLFYLNGLGVHWLLLISHNSWWGGVKTFRDGVMNYSQSIMPISLFTSTNGMFLYLLFMLVVTNCIEYLISPFLCTENFITFFFSFLNQREKRKSYKDRGWWDRQTDRQTDIQKVGIYYNIFQRGTRY